MHGMPKLPHFVRGIDVLMVPSLLVQDTPRRLFLKNHLLYYVPFVFPHYVTDLKSTFEAYLQKFSSKSRSTLARKVRKFRDAAGVDEVLREYKTASQLREFQELTRPLSAKTYQERLLKEGLPQDVDFWLKAEALAQADSVRAYTLHLKGRPIAYLYSPAEDGVLFYKFLGYDPQHAKLSPGIVLQYLAFERLFAEQRFHLFDFEEGEGQHKRQFATALKTCAAFYIFRVTIRSLLCVVLHMLFATTTHGVLWVFNKLGLRRRARKLLR
jgi:CelD/BcsL family acetyltransferase involved in cellulose biosynthesis